VEEALVAQQVSLCMASRPKVPTIRVWVRKRFAQHEYVSFGKCLHFEVFVLEASWCRRNLMEFMRILHHIPPELIVHNLTPLGCPHDCFICNACPIEYETVSHLAKAIGSVDE